MKEAEAHDAHRHNNFLADWGGRRVACWCDYEGGGFGLVGDIVVGIIGSLIGGWLFGLLGIAAGGLIGSIIAAVVGAIILIAIVRLIKRA